MAHLFLEEPTHCMRQIAKLVGEPNATEIIGDRIVSSILALRPSRADKHMRFTDKLLLPDPVRFYSIDRVCLAQLAAS